MPKESTDTKIIIAKTLFEMLDENPSQKISVKQLIETCGISRQIFYYYYQDIFDVLEYGLSLRQDHLIQDFFKSGYNDEETTRTFLVQSAQSLKCIAAFMDGNHRKETEHIIYKRMRAFVEQLFSNSDKEVKLPINNGKDREFYVDFFAAAGMQYMLMKYEEGCWDPDFFFREWMAFFKSLGLL